MEAATQLASIVGELVGKEYRQLRGVGGQVAELSDELDTMNAILRMLSDAEEGTVDHFIRVWMKQVRELAYDAEDCVHLYILRIRCRPKDRFLVWSKRMLSTLFPRRRLAREIEALRARAVVISERHARYGVSREALLRGSTSSLPAPAPVPGHALGRLAANGHDQLVGITDKANKLAEKVEEVSENEHDKKLKVFSIVGFGGLGNATLAMEVCRKLEGSFQRQALVSVSQAFHDNKDLEGLLKRMLQQIVELKPDNAKGIKEEDPLDGINEMGVDLLTIKLNELLRDIRYTHYINYLSVSFLFTSPIPKSKMYLEYLIVVDDVWTVAAWDTIGSKLPDYNNGSRIIVTTRIEIVANACSGSSVDGDCIYRIKPLDTGDSKTLFLSRVLRSKSDTLPNNLKAEMNKILEKCGGLPMAIISIASILGSYTSSESKDTWERVRKSIGSQMESHPTLEGMKQIVTLSYNHLHYYLKGCMMYVSIFPKDYVIVKNRLLRRWVAEGLVAEIRGLTLMEVAEAYYNELVSRSMIDRAGDIVNHYDGRLETCRVHDMVLEVMVSKSLEANFVSLVGGSYEGMSYGSIRRLSIHAGEEVVSMESPSNKITSSHAMKNGIEGMKMEHVRSLSMFDLRDHMRVLDRLGEFSLPRVLDLEDCMGIENKHLRHVCRMYLLRFLSMKGTSIDEMPPEVGDLENLETLDVRETNLEDLPETVSKLEKLEHLQINNKADKYLGCWIARRGLGRMKALRMVNTVVFGSYSLSKMYSLRWLSIGSKGYKDSDALNFLDGINPPPPLLEYLRIGASIDELPNWVSSLNNLVEIVIAWTYLFGAQLFGPVCELPNLKRMHLERYSCRDAELIAETAYAFPALKDLYVNFLYEDIEVLLFQEASMAKLETLSVRFPTDVFKEVAGMEHLRSLKEVQLIGRKGNSSLGYALDQLKKLNEKRQESNMIKVAVKYE
ncbi:disease resistance protein Pik-2-like [Triticum dicoccoides]|uniref:disease resistance protein Pik-2-like n=1 Tax=Triticum dicoccoides TaxID=85692 RepID=UPI00188E5EB4|nr:disease resistance protein Pik-2-like [Triticum dicoccoides]